MKKCILLTTIMLIATIAHAMDNIEEHIKGYRIEEEICYITNHKDVKICAFDFENKTLGCLSMRSPEIRSHSKKNETYKDLPITHYCWAKVLTTPYRGTSYTIGSISIVQCLANYINNKLLAQLLLKKATKYIQNEGLCDQMQKEIYSYDNNKVELCRSLGFHCQEFSFVHLDGDEYGYVCSLPIPRNKKNDD
jgi:hypothetical protein